jgi:hypothetical protein
VLIGKYRVDNIVEANITWVSRDSKEQFTKGGTTPVVPFFPPNPLEGNGYPPERIFDDQSVLHLSSNQYSKRRGDGSHYF